MVELMVLGFVKRVETLALSCGMWTVVEDRKAAAFTGEQDLLFRLHKSRNRGRQRNRKTQYFQMHDVFIFPPNLELSEF